jgi:hypothetical protein
MILLRQVPKAVEIRDGWKTYIVVVGVMVLIIMPPATIQSIHPSLISTTMGTYLSRIMIDSLMMAF